LTSLGPVLLSPRVREALIENIISRGTQVLVPPDSIKRKAARPGWHGGLYEHMRRVLRTDHGAELYRRRQAMIEPVFAQTKSNHGMDQFRRRGRSAVRTEWRLINAAHNLLKLHRHQLVTATA
jgi:Transposase DDE domain